MALVPGFLVGYQEHDTLDERNQTRKHGPEEQQVKNAPPLSEIKTVYPEAAQENRQKAGGQLALVAPAKLRGAAVRANWRSHVEGFSARAACDHAGIGC